MSSCGRFCFTKSLKRSCVSSICAFEFLESVFRDFTEHRDRAFKFARGDFAVIDVVIFQNFIEIWNLRDHADTTEDREWCGDNLIRHACHHVAAARCDFIDANREANACRLQTCELACGEAVARDEAATTFKFQDDFVFWALRSKESR